MKEQILKLRQEGKSYEQIVKIVGCTKSTVSYYCGQNQQEKTLNRQRKNRAKAHPFKKKLELFLEVYKPISKTVKSKRAKLIYSKLRDFCRGENNMSFSLEDVISKFGEKPKCYLTGEEVNIYEPKTYQFDHKIPKSRGGDNSLENLGICSKRANLSKTDMTPDEYINLCKKVLEYNGYTVTKN